MYRKHYSTRQTPQSEALEDQVPNSAGGHAWSVTDWDRLDRFLILGAEGGTYYIGEQKLVRENAKAVQRCIVEDGIRTVERIVEVSHAGRAPKNDPALFALAMCAAAKDEKTRKAALTALPKVARIGTHLFHFAEYVEGFRGWGRGLRQAVARWYTEMPTDRLALQAIKYQQRDGWSHRDLLRLSHPVTDDLTKRDLYNWVCRGKPIPDVPLIQAVNKLSDCGPLEACDLIRNHNIPREALPTEWLKSVDVWDALLADMPMTAMIRNLGKMSAVGLLKPMSAAAGFVAGRVVDDETLKRARIHPLTLLVAQKVYEQGRGDRGSLTWEPVASIVDGLDNAFYKAFGNVEATNKRILLALDVSGSMSSGRIAGSPLTPREGSAAMALVTAASEPNHHIVGFSCDGANAWRAGERRRWGWASGITPLPISPKQRLSDVVRKVSGLDFGGTDCALPMLYAMDRGLEVDAFVIYTDSETWAGDIHPTQALQQYRNKTGINAKLIVVGMVSNGFSIADPNDAGMLDVVGFDTATPAVIGNFISE